MPDVSSPRVILRSHEMFSRLQISKGTSESKEMALVLFVRDIYSRNYFTLCHLEERYCLLCQEALGTPETVKIQM